MTTLPKELILIEIALEKRKAAKELKELTRDINKFAKESGMSVRLSSKEVANAQKQAAQEARLAQRKIQEAINETQKKARMWKSNMLGMGMSFLFTGMAVKRMFDTIRTESFNTFNKLTANTDMANNATNRLNMAMDYMKFTIADAINSALEPMMPTIMNIIEGVTNWIEQNSELTGKIIIWGGAIATVVMIIGELGLALLGVYSAIAILFGIDAANAFIGISKGATTAIGSEAAGTGVLGLNKALLALGKLVVVGYSVKVTLDAVKSATSTDDAATQFYEVIESSIGAALAVGFGSSLLGFSASTSALAGGYAFVAVISIGMLYLFTQTFKKAPGDTIIPDNGLIDSSISGDTINTIRQREEVFNRVFSDNDLTNRLNTQMIETLKKSRETNIEIDDNIVQLRDTVNNTTTVVTDIDSLVTLQKSVNEDMSDNAIKTKDNLGILASDENTQNIITIVDSNAMLGTSLKSVVRDILSIQSDTRNYNTRLNTFNRFT
ncbi:MAG: hypothetical protein PHC31_10430 [Clostridia bacterium]|nr:hypothetical protein [Clostridia bacterium]MDD3972315.1 hypothetical protein [Clostridia bacterium]